MVAVGYTGGDPNKVSTTGYVKGEVLAADGTGTLQPLPVGTDGQVLEALSTAPDGVAWATGGGGGGTPSGTVVSETSFGQGASAGVSALYSRGDHTHGSPSVSPLILPDTLTPGAAPVGGLDLYSHNQNGQSTLRVLTPENVELDVFRDMIFIARNVTGVTIPIGTPVYFSDVFTGGEITPIVTPAQANNLATVAQGVTWEAIPNNGYGRVLTKGRIFNLNTSAWTVNSWLYLSASTPGGLTTVRPSVGNYAQTMAFVLRSHATLGELFVTTNNPTQVASTNVGYVFPPSGYGLIAMSGSPESFMGVSALANNNPFFVRVYVPPGKAITSVYVAVRDAGTYDGVTTGNTLTIWDDSVPTNQLGTIGETPTLWTANGWRGGNVVGGPIAATLGERFIYVGCIARGMTVSPNLAYMTSAADAHTAWFDFGPGNTHKRGMYATATSLPASFDPTTFGTTTTFLIMAGIA